MKNILKILCQFKLLCFHCDISNIQKCNFKECPLTWVAPLIVFLLYFQYIETYEIKISRGFAKRLDNKIIKRTFQTLWNTKHAQQQNL
jgi:hypothetical protein